ncbi:OLC1v1004749C1 [Oldenlandia corymbosa var. corymbosa]|uniref:OLC1v1004749C1 n=1 Tax=Oldenlandia corymbosa var. corymbosa TaxID=529605 RepID=A0AAV1DFQ2_OLDCO|nr:OLC1v1004749C1 [Oldenlandia corymbosa var. corymbosa]
MAFFQYLLLLLSISSFTITAESAELWTQYCNENSLINTTQLSANIDALLPQLVSGTISNGYITTSYGKSPNQVYGLAQCRGDVSESDCASCIQDAAKQIRELCPKQADARVWYDYCFLRYSPDEFAGRVDTSVGIIFYNVENVTDPDSFNKKLGSLSDKISKEAVSTSGNRGFIGRGKTDLSDFEKIYALVQCTRDLSQLYCAQCLAQAIGQFPNTCNNKKGCRVLYSSCIVRYELYPFFFPLDPKETLVHVPLKNYASVIHKH